MTNKPKMLSKNLKLNPEISNQIQLKYMYEK